ncbi:hypothetical protein ACPC54_31340 [Kitasatospora sp. NPDC094028]
MDADGWAGEVARLVRARVPDVVVERPDGTGFLMRLPGSAEAVELESGPSGRPPFTVSDEYSWVEAHDPAAAAEAVLGLLRA